MLYLIRNIVLVACLISRLGLLRAGDLLESHPRVQHPQTEQLALPHRRRAPRELEALGFR